MGNGGPTVIEVIKICHCRDFNHISCALKLLLVTLRHACLGGGGGGGGGAWDLQSMSHFIHIIDLIYTKLVVLTVASVWRSFLTTLEWPLEDAIISAVSPFCEEVWREKTY